MHWLYVAWQLGRGRWQVKSCLADDGCREVIIEEVNTEVITEVNKPKLSVLREGTLAGGGIPAPCSAMPDVHTSNFVFV